jgi:hypothetical protein
VSAELEKGTIENPNPNGDQLVGPGPGPEGKKSNLGWKISAGVGGLVMVGGLWYAYDNWSEFDSLHKEQCAHGLVPKGSNEPCPTTDPWTDAQADDSNRRGDDYAKKANIGWGIAAVGAAWTAFSVYKVVTSTSSSKERQGARGKRQRKDRTYIVTPTASPKGGGATLRFDW